MGRGQGRAFCKALWETRPQDRRVEKGWHAWLDFRDPPSPPRLWNFKMKNAGG